MIIIFNGPPGSGKDEASMFMQCLGFHPLSFKHQLFKETMRHFCVDKNWFMLGYEDRKQKEKPEPLLEGMSRREAMIFVSEGIIKPMYGSSYFGDQVASKIKYSKDYVISDGGFLDELMPIINKIGCENILIIQLVRDNCTFSNDSRRYFNGRIDEEFVINFKSEFESGFVVGPKLPIKTFRIHNNGSLEEFYDVLLEVDRMNY